MNRNFDEDVSPKVFFPAGTRVRRVAITVPTPMATWWHCQVLQNPAIVRLYDGGDIRQAAVANFDGVAR